MKLSNTFIKQVLKYNMCPAKFKAYYLDNEFDSTPSMAMFRGIYFEYELLGNLPRSGETPVYPLGKRGKHEIHKSRIDKQIADFPAIMEKEGITVLGGVENIEWRYNKVLTLTLTLDSMVVYKDRLYVGDIKLSQDMESSFGAVAWGDYERMDKLQAHLYSYVMSQVLDEPVGFIYMVFDYKKDKGGYKIFEEWPDKTDTEAMFERIVKAERKMHWMKATAYKPLGSVENCKSCKVADCHARITEKKIEAPVKPKVFGRTVSVDLEKLLDFMTHD
jgi:hypothetical protein